MERYKAFVSCSIHEKDEPIVNMVELILERWGFDHCTVGRTINKPEPIMNTIEQLISEADCLVGIATKRFQEEATGTWRTFEWLHGESGIAVGMGKPIFIIKDENVQIDGVLPTVTQMISIDSGNPYSLLEPQNKQLLDNYISYLRDVIKVKKSDEFWSNVGNIALGIGAIAAAAGAGYHLAKSNQYDEDEEDVDD